jgi:hypothetical protein
MAAQARGTENMEGHGEKIQTKKRRHPDMEDITYPGESFG